MAESILQGVTTSRPFLPCNPQKSALFSVNPGVPVEDALSMVSCLLGDALSAMNALETSAPERLVEMAKAALDAVLDGAMKGGAA